MALLAAMLSVKSLNSQHYFFIRITVLDQQSDYQLLQQLLFTHLYPPHACAYLAASMQIDNTVTLIIIYFHLPGYWYYPARYCGPLINAGSNTQTT